MLNFINARTQFANDCNSAGIRPDVTDILLKIPNHEFKSFGFLTDSLIIQVNYGGPLLPVVEIIHIGDDEDETLASVKVAYYEDLSDLYAAGFDLLYKCNLTADELDEAQETLNFFVCDAASDTL